MSVAGSDYGGSSYGRSEPRPDKQLIVKCTHEEQGSKKITFQSSRICTYDNLRKQVEKGFGLAATPFNLVYDDDEAEANFISNEAELTEAITYFNPTPSEDPPSSSAASILSGRSFSRAKITLRLRVVVDYDSISLSDTGSLVSLEEYKDRNGSGYSISYTSEMSQELEDDAITVSSKDIGSKYDAYGGMGRGTKTIVAGPSREPLIQSGERWKTRTVSSAPRTSSSKQEKDPFLPSDDSLTRYTEDPSSVFARLKLEEERLGLSPGNLNGASTFQTERGANWLREQNAHNPMLSGDGGSVSDFSLEDSVSLALEQNQHGNYRYTLTGSSGSAASQSVRDYGYDDGASAGVNDGVDNFSEPLDKGLLSRHTSLQATQYTHPHRSSNPFMIPEEQPYNHDYIHPDIPPEVLSFLRPESPLGPPPDPSTCSNCSIVLDMIKYVCSTCGEKKPHVDEQPEWSNDVKGKTRAIDIHREHTYPPLHKSPAASASSLTVIGSQHSGSGSGSGSSGSSDRLLGRSMSESTLPSSAYKPLPATPSLAVPVSSSSSLGTLSGAGTEARRPEGYELCSNCVQAYGVEHSLEFSATPGTSPGPGTSPEDAERARSRLRRTAPSQKGVLRHAYIEKSWTRNGWEDVEQGGEGTCRCSTCNTVINGHRYKCLSCDAFNLCRACYRQVYEVHPSHAFLAVQDKPSSSSSSTAMVDLSRQAGSMEESCKPIAVHITATNYHCMQEIVGARFHCAICENVDICSNCDAAGLPGNLDSDDGGHFSSHIMIKIPHPMSTADLHSTSQMAIKLWTGRDAQIAQADGTNGRPRRNSLGSSYSHTVLGSGARADAAAVVRDHGVGCDACAQPIVGVRYQCANCSTYPNPVSLCERCETRSYALHDPYHFFFKLPKPVDHALNLHPPLPSLYKKAAGPAGEYLRTLTHNFAVCDRCMQHISGEWFHCAYCPKDLCDSCAEVDTHDNTHLFVVFKSEVNMGIFRRFMNEEDPSRSPPLIPFPVYNT
ncbi:hypothetical protein C8Q80DRAFT_1222448 [Daedaleopsis nitida]|nr:hypothetical protein C8Q80DRAFT_1222448 [Daedaleopsis nitida]